MDTQELQRLKNKFDIVGNDAALNRALETAVAVAPTDLSVLVIGETGVGKENIPKVIHQNSRRKNGKYFAVNCGAIPEGTIESELFGHKKGSFTGAIEDRVGYFEEADGGTLFLDEIGELPLPFQAKLLRVLQQGEYTRVGESKVRKTDVRVIAATNVDLRHAVAHGKFRQDLYYRLNTVQIHLPSLREMKDDIYMLFRKFAADYSEKYGMKKVVLTKDAISLLMNYRWPGNIRQLQNVTYAIEALESGKSSGPERLELDAMTISQYLPKDEDSYVPAVVTGGGSGSLNDDERNQIYGAILQLKNEIEDLKKQVDQMKSGSMEPAPRALPAMTGAEPQPQPAMPEEPEEQEWVEASPKTIRQSKDEQIIDALKKHNGNRKKVAEELQISQRTLYRWLDKNPEYKSLVEK